MNRKTITYGLALTALSMLSSKIKIPATEQVHTGCKVDLIRAKTSLDRLLPGMACRVSFV